MKQSEIIKRLARVTGQTKAAAADQLDQLVAHIVENLRIGKRASLPGIGALKPGPEHRVSFAKKAKG